ncbi:unnamed protein product [Symbiodinium sp. KB8]|nr:unnamed protein product [Symbiodinium sp. KB8]
MAELMNRIKTELLGEVDRMEAAAGENGGFQTAVEASTETRSIEALTALLEEKLPARMREVDMGEGCAPGPLPACAEQIRDCGARAEECQGHCATKLAAVRQLVGEIVENGKAADMAADEETLRSQREEELQPLRTKTVLLSKLYGDEGADRDEILEEVYTAEEVAAMKQEDKESVPKRWLSEHGALAKTVSQNLRASAGLPEPHKAINDLKQSETEVQEQARVIAQKATESQEALFALQTYEENLRDKKRQIEDLRGGSSAKVTETGELLQAKWSECQELLAQYRFDHLRNELLYVRERIAEDAHTRAQEELNTAREAWQITEEQAERCQSEAEKCVSDMKAAREEADGLLLEHTQGPVKARWLTSEISHQIAEREVARQEKLIREVEKEKAQHEQALAKLERQKREGKKNQNAIHNEKDKGKQVARKIANLTTDLHHLQEQAAAAANQCAALKALAARHLGDAATLEGVEAEIERSYGSKDLLDQEFESDDWSEAASSSEDLQGWANMNASGARSSDSAGSTALAKRSDMAKVIEDIEKKWRKDLSATEQKCADQLMKIDRLEEQAAAAANQCAALQAMLQQLQQERSTGAGDASPHGSLSSFTMVDQPQFMGGATQNVQGPEERPETEAAGNGASSSTRE